MRICLSVGKSTTETARALVTWFFQNKSKHCTCRWTVKSNTADL